MNLIMMFSVDEIISEISGGIINLEKKLIYSDQNTKQEPIYLETGKRIEFSKY